MSGGKRADQAAWYRLLFERNVAGVYRSTPDGVMLECNDAFARIMGYADAAEACARPAGDFHHEERQRSNFLQQLRAAGTLTNLEARARGKNGQTVWILENAVLSVVDGQEVIEGTIADLTDRKRVEEALRQSEARYRSLFSRNVAGVFRSTLSGRLVEANDACARIFGCATPEEFLRLDPVNLHRNPEARTQLMDRLRKEGVIRNQELLLRRPDGVEVCVLVNLSIGETGDDGEEMLEGTIFDITDRKESESERRRAEEERTKLERQLAQSQKMEAIGKLAGGVAHDFNNLLTAIAGYSELLIGALADDDPRRSHVLEIQKAGERAATLTRQLLAFSRRQMLEPRVLDLNAVIENMEKMLERVIGAHIRIHTRKASDLGHVRADPGQIEQAILNLVVNARDAMPSGGTLEIATQEVRVGDARRPETFPMQPGIYSVVAISDTGVGISPEVKARLFEPFFTTKEQGKGTGLGLSTTYGIVKQSGGYIWCDSEPGRGSTFRIFLPRVEEPLPAAEPETARPKNRPNHEKILLVEDEPEVRRLVEKVLKLQGYDVVAASNPAEALEIERGLDQNLDLLITDVVMPGMSGRELADRLAPLRPRMKILFVSGYTDDAIVHEGVLGPGTDFLQKPFSPAALGRKIREILDARAAEPRA